MNRRGFYIGRFQPYHNGHQSVLERIACSADEIVIGVGSAQLSHTVANPFTAGERVLMLTRSLEGLGCPFYVIPIEDIQRNALWVAHVRSMTPFDTAHPVTPRHALLQRNRGMDVQSPDMYERQTHSGTEIRRRMLDGEPWEHLVPPAVVDVIREIHGVERLQRIAGSD